MISDHWSHVVVAFQLWARRMLQTSHIPSFINPKYIKSELDKLITAVQLDEDLLGF
jgi:hypothetical protein